MSVAQRLVSLIPEHGCSAEWLRMQTSMTLQQVEEGLHQAVVAGLALRRDNRYLRQVTHQPPVPAPAASPEIPDEPAPPAEDTPMPKTCIRCEKSLPVSEFGDDSRTEDGKAKTCKGCRGKPPKARETAKAARPPAKPAKASAEPDRPLLPIVQRLEQIGAKPIAVALEQLRAQRAKLDAAIAALEAL